jgi:superfamily II DNA or RNA helicase
MIEVSSNSKYKLVYSIVDHPQIGPVIKPYVVQMTPNGNYSLVFEHIISGDLKFYNQLDNEETSEIIKLLDTLTSEAITKKFSPKKKIRPSEFFEKIMSDYLFKSSIKPYIDSILLQVINKIPTDHFFLFDYKNPTYLKIEVLEEESKALFHFRRNENGTNYFITVKSGTEVFSQFHRDTLVLTDSPCWLLVKNKLLHFEPNFEGQKIAPFLQNPYLHIKPIAEEQFYQKFALPLIEQYAVNAQGIIIENEQFFATPVVRLEKTLRGNYVLNLMFNYGSQLFHHHAGNIISAVLIKQEGDLRIKKIRRNKEWENHKFRKLIELGFIFKQNSEFVAPDKEGLHGLINYIAKTKLELENAGFEIRQQLYQKSYFIGDADLTFSVTLVDDWFDIKAKVKFGEFEIPFVHLRKNILAKIEEFILPDGSIAIIPQEWFERLSGIIAESEDDELRIPHQRLGIIQEQLAPFVIDAETKKLIQSFEKVEEKELPMGFKGILRPYQKAGYDWFFFLQSFKFGGCLADDMGLGKTVQTLALLLQQKEQYLESKSKSILNTVNEPILQEITTAIGSPQLDIFSQISNISQVHLEKNNRPVNLLVVPASLIYNWMNEGLKFAPNLRFLNHTGLNRNKNSAYFSNYDVVVTTYGTLRNDIQLMAAFNFNYIILDESQIIKNADSQTAKNVVKLNSKFRLTLTGTPLENSVEDLWSQINFLNPGLLGSLSSFRKNYILPIEKNGDEDKLNTLQAIIKPFILRRTKKQVAKDLPEKTEQVIYCEMHPEQKSLYEKVKSKYRNEILNSIAKYGVNKSKMYVIKGLTELRQIANHPQLTETDFEDYSGKFEEIIRMTETAINEGHKVLLFSQFVRFLNLFREHFDAKNIQYCYLDGSTKSKDRAAQVDEFQNNESKSLFLISLKAGGTGLNLTAADYVFIADPWWNPASERQAIDRSHRIGQTQNVFSYKFISKATVEEKILSLQEKKKELSEAIITVEDSFVKQLSAIDIESLFD